MLQLCGRFGPGAVTAFFWRWFPRLPQVLTTADLRAGYVHELAFRQFEVAGGWYSTALPAGRAFFEGLIRDHLDVGRPDCVSLTFGRRVTASTPGAFRTKVITEASDDGEVKPGFPRKATCLSRPAARVVAAGLGCCVSCAG